MERFGCYWNLQGDGHTRARRVDMPSNRVGKRGRLPLVILDGPLHRDPNSVRARLWPPRRRGTRITTWMLWPAAGALSQPGRFLVVGVCVRASSGLVEKCTGGSKGTVLLARAVRAFLAGSSGL